MEKISEVAFINLQTNTKKIENRTNIGNKKPVILSHNIKTSSDESCVIRCKYVNCLSYDVEHCGLGLHNRCVTVHLQNWTWCKMLKHLKICEK